MSRIAARQVAVEMGGDDPHEVSGVPADDEVVAMAFEQSPRSEAVYAAASSSSGKAALPNRATA